MANGRQGLVVSVVALELIILNSLHGSRPENTVNSPQPDGADWWNVRILCNEVTLR